jgi:cytochrome b561
VRLQQRRHTLAATKRLFDLWHVFHLPLVWVMFAIVSLHVAVALYLGYVPFRW